MNCTEQHTQLVYTIKDRCRVCYTCVRECPAKAIRIINGQAEVMPQRCIGCGNCVRVCSQGAKAFADSREQVKSLLKNHREVIAVVAPSFPAEFSDIPDYRKLVGMIRELGFSKVLEVAFGADMVAREYGKLLEEGQQKRYISSDCPAIANFIQYYHPDLVENLAPIASPMVAISRIARKMYGEAIKIVFIGPCVAKKEESGEIDGALTFKELRAFLGEFNIDPEGVEPKDFDPPHSGRGAIFPVSRGLLHTVRKSEDISESNVLVAEGKTDFRLAISEFEKGSIKSHHLQLLCCEGCIMGPGMTNGGDKFEKVLNIGNYVRNKLDHIDQKQWEEQVKACEDIDFSQTFSEVDKRMMQPSEEKINEVLRSMGKFSEKDHLNCKACGYSTCREHAIAIIEGLAENEMCLPYTIEKLHKSIVDLNNSNDQLASTQQALKQSEKLASMGQLSAGIAHELNNPLGVITMYSNILKEEAPQDDPVRKDLELIVEQSERCKNIVGGLLNFARKNQVSLVDTDLVLFVRHSLESLIKPENIIVNVIDNLGGIKAMIDRDQMMQVLTNLEKNAVEAMPDGGILTIELNHQDREIEIKVSDTGIGIPDKNMDKIFTPFFTTKAMGKGTGLGLPLIYGIIKMHKGQIHVVSNADPEKGPTGTTFKLRIPAGN